MPAILTRTTVVLPFLWLTGVLSKVCYDASGNENLNLLDCNPSAAVSACCKPGETCYSNGLCVAADPSTALSNYYYNGCTDPSFGSAPCISSCLHSGGYGITACSSLGFGEYCCYGLDGCACNNSTAFSLPAGSVLTILPTTIATASATSSVGSSTAVSSTFASSTLSTSASAATNSASSTNSPSPGNNTGKDIGIGVGVGLGVAALVAGALVVWIVKRRSSKKRMPQNAVHPAASAQYYDNDNRQSMPEMGSNNQQISPETKTYNKGTTPAELQYSRPRPTELP